jgi:ferredoxin
LFVEQPLEAPSTKLQLPNKSQIKNNKQMKIKIVVHRDLCQSVATCVAVAPTAYALDDDFKAKVVDTDAKKQGEDYSYVMDVDDGKLKDLVSGAKACPYKAIEVINEKTGKTLYPK